MKLNTVAIVMALGAVVNAAPLEGCDQGDCPAINAGFDFIEGIDDGYNPNAIRIRAHNECGTHYLNNDGCNTFSFKGGYYERVCIDRANVRATRTGTGAFVFHQCWAITKSFYCNGRALWTPSHEIPCNFKAAEN